MPSRAGENEECRVLRGPTGGRINKKANVSDGLYFNIGHGRGWQRERHWHSHFV